jgi:hypothetical protein
MTILRVIAADKQFTSLSQSSRSRFLKFAGSEHPLSIAADPRFTTFASSADANNPKRYDDSKSMFHTLLGKHRFGSVIDIETAARFVRLAPNHADEPGYDQRHVHHAVPLFDYDNGTGMQRVRHDASQPGQQRNEAC